MKGIKKLFAVGCAAVVASCGVVLSACGEEDVEKFISEAYAASKEVQVNGLDMTIAGDMVCDMGGMSISMPLNGEVLVDGQNSAIDMSLNMGTSTNSAYIYGYYRDGYMFTSEPSTLPQTSSDSMILTVQSASGGVALPDGGMTSVPSDLDISYIFAVASVAQSYGAASVKDGKITLNTLALFKGIYDDVNEIVQGLTAETTISDIYASDLFRTAVHAAGKVVTPQELYDFIDGIASDAMNALALPVPEEDAELYDYIGSVLADAAFAQSAGVDGSIGSQNVLELIQAASGSQITAQEIKEAFDAAGQYFNFDNGLTIIAEGSFEMNISKADIIYTFDGKVLSGGGADMALSITLPDYTYDISINMGIEYSENAPQLADINSATVYTGTSYMTVEEYLASLSQPSV